VASQTELAKAFTATILIVDDAPENLTVLSELLQPTYQVLATHSGKRTLEIAASVPKPDLILLDVMMPEMDGYAVLAQLKANPTTEDIPVIFVTAMDADEDQRRGLDLGALDYISKPLRPSIILARVRTQIDLKRARDWMRDQNAILVAEVARRVAENEVINLRELSERSRTEKELRESEMRWQFAVESHGDAMWDWDADKDELFLTAAAKELFDLPDTDSTRPIANLIARLHPDDRAALQGQIDDIIAGKTSEWLGEWRLSRPGGMPRWIATRGRVMTRAANGRPQRIVSISHDATQRKRREAEAGRQKELVAQQGRLVLLGELASALAHEINQPLTAIAGFSAECARRIADNPRALELVRTIEEQAIRAGEIAWRMRGFARRQRLGRTALSLHEIIAGVAKWIRMDSSYLDAVIDITGVGSHLPQVYGDRVELEQVLFNLVRNGIEAGLPNVKEQRIAIAGRPGERPGEVEISVTDWGCGLPANADFDVFQPFTSSKELGLGLGLTICFSIIEGHGGHLWTTANPEGGTIFHFTLPEAGPAVPPNAENIQGNLSYRQ